MRTKKKLSLLRQQINYWHSMTDNNEHMEVRLIITSFLFNMLGEPIAIEYHNLQDLYKKYIKSPQTCEDRIEFFDYFEKNIENKLCEEALSIVVQGLR